MKSTSESDVHMIPDDFHDPEKAKGAAGNPGGQGAPIVQSNDTTTQPKPSPR
jgi:hypothetical protein